MIDKELIQFMKENKQFTPAMVAERLDCSRRRAYDKINGYYITGLVEKVTHGVYEVQEKEFTAYLEAVENSN